MSIRIASRQGKCYRYYSLYEAKRLSVCILKVGLKTTCLAHEYVLPVKLTFDKVKRQNRFFLYNQRAYLKLQYSSEPFYLIAIRKFLIEFNSRKYLHQNVLDAMLLNLSHIHLIISIRV